MNDRPVLLTGEPWVSEDDCACSDRACSLTAAPAVLETDQDCACAERATSLCAEPSQLAAYVQPPQSYVTELTPDYHLVFSPFSLHGPGVLNAEGWQRWQSFGQPQPLTEPFDHQLAAQHLVVPHNRSLRVLATQPSTLTAWLHVTNACNLDCPYCYVRKSSAGMTAEVGRQSLEMIVASARQHGFQRVKLKYAGGEASLHFKLVRQLQAYARELAHQAELNLAAVVLSNGVHWRYEDAAWLADHELKLMISIDGVGAEHDRLRSDRRGQGTFDRVRHTIDDILLPQGVRPDITMTITRCNAASVADVVRWAVVERDLPLSLNFYRQPAQAPADMALEEAAIIDGMRAAYAVLEQHLLLRANWGSWLDRVQGEAHDHTCGVGQSYVVVSHTGHIAQCQMQLEHAVSPAPQADVLPLIASGPIRNLPVEQKAGCRECLYRYYCSGGCPIETYRATGRWDVQSPHCRIYQALLPEALRLEGLRLLKLHGMLPQ
jgi:uncharacterized protein